MQRKLPWLHVVLKQQRPPRHAHGDSSVFNGVITTPGAPADFFSALILLPLRLWHELFFIMLAMTPRALPPNATKHAAIPMQPSEGLPSH